MTICEERKLQAEVAIEVESVDALIEVANREIDKESCPVRISAFLGYLAVEELVEGKRGWKLIYKTNYPDHTPIGFKVHNKELDSPQHYLPYENDHTIRVESVRDCVNRILNK